VAEAVSKGKGEQLQSADLTAVRVLEELRKIAFLDVRGFYDAAGNLKLPSELTEDQGAALQAFEVLKKNVAAGDGHIDTVHKIRLWDKTRALEMLAKHFALLTEVVQVNRDDALIERLLAGRKRAAEGRKG
jgi:phage terminase small subunit